MANQFQLAGAQETKPVRFAPIFTNRFFTGLWTNRNPLRDAGSTRGEEKYYGSRGDSMIAGSNVEISTRLTPVRRPGTSVYNSQTFNAVDFFYEFRLFSGNTETIKVITDTPTALYEATGPANKNLIWTKSAGAGQSYMQYVANILYFGNGVDTKKWLQTLTSWTALTSYSITPTNGQMSTFIIDPNGNLQQLIAYGITTITNVAIDGANTLTLTVVSNTGLTVGSKYVLWGLTTATFLNGATITVLTKPAGQVTASFTHALYASAADTGAVTQLQGGSPISGATAPTWNVSSTAPNNATIDASAVWVNRGSPVQNWGIAAPTTQPTVVTSGGTYRASTFYSNNGQVIIDSNGNLQQVTTTGTSGSTAPTWATSVGLTTTDGTVVWTMLQTSASLTWAAGTTYTAGTSFIKASAAGTQCLFLLAPLVSITFDPAFPVSAAFYTKAANGTINIRYNGPPAGTVQQWNGSAWVGITAAGTATNLTSLLFNPANATDGKDPSTQPMVTATLNGAGSTTAKPTLWSGANEQWLMAVYGHFTVPAAGAYNFMISHDDAMQFAVQGASGTGKNIQITGFNYTNTAYQGYQFSNGTILGNNANGMYANESYQIVFPNAGSFPFEFDYGSWHSGQTLVVTCNGYQITPTPSISGPTTPTWPAWTDNLAPGYPHVNETIAFMDGNGNSTTLNCPFGWNNLGPATDFVWHASTYYPYTGGTTAASVIDSNGYYQVCYRTGVTGTGSAPTWKTALNAITKDTNYPTLEWINEGTPPSVPAGTMGASSAQGWIYYVALVNTLTNTVSNCGPAATQTGPVYGANSILITGGLPSVIDPQCDYVAVFRTLDGGSTPFLIPGVGNSVYTIPLAQYQASGYTDTSKDAALNILMQGSINLVNTPPPSNAVNLTYHLNRIFFSSGNAVYWTAGPYATIGNGYEGVPPSNYAMFPSMVTRIVPTSYGCFVFTVSDVYLISGQATTGNPLFAQPYATGIGLLSYNALAINGTVIYLFTSDSQMISFDPSSGISQMGFPIGDQFTKSNWSPANTYVTWHVSGSMDHALYVSDGSTGWFRMTPTASPESGLTWSPFATITGGCKAVQSVEVSPGVHKLLVGPSASGPILARDLTTWQDNGTSYTATFTVGSIMLAHPGQIAELAFITTDATATGTPPTLGVLLGEISGTFDPLTKFTADPPQLAPSTSIYSQRFYFSQTRDPAVCRHLQYQVNWPAENAGNELLTLTMFGGFMQET